MCLDCIPIDSVGANIIVPENKIEEIKSKILTLPSSELLVHKTEYGLDENSWIYSIVGSTPANYTEIRIQTIKNRLEGIFGSKKLTNHTRYKKKTNNKLKTYLKKCQKFKNTKNKEKFKEKEFYEIFLNLAKLYGIKPNEFLR